jgi:hypothetical protein
VIILFLDPLILLHLDSHRHFIARRLSYTPKSTEPEHHEPTSDHRLPLHFPKPLKNMISRSTEHLPVPKTGDGRNMEIEAPLDVGEVLSRGTPFGLRIRSREGGLRGLAWSDEEFVVSIHNLLLLYIYLTLLSRSLIISKSLYRVCGLLR